MKEQKLFPGLWTCPDYDKPTNYKAPFTYKCTGMELTEQGCDDLSNAIAEAIQKTN